MGSDKVSDTESFVNSWTPQYEVTATGIKMEKRANDYLALHIQIKSGNNTIHPFGCMTWSKIDNDDGTFSESFVDKYDVIDLVSGKTPFAITDIPKLVLNDKVSYFVQVNGRVEKVYLLTPNDDTYGKVKGLRFETLDKICEVLDCQPGDILERKGGESNEQF